MKRPPLLTQKDVEDAHDNWADRPNQPLVEYFVRDAYEDARHKDAELIQNLVDGWYAGDGGRSMIEAVAAAEAAGFKPSQP